MDSLKCAILLLLASVAAAQSPPSIIPAVSQGYINLDENQQSLSLSYLSASDTDGNIYAGEAGVKYLIDGVASVSI